MEKEAKFSGMGSILHPLGVAFRLWAPNARQVAVIGTFNDWDATRHLLQEEGHGYWYGDVKGAHAGDQYRFLLTTATGEYTRIDPYAREVTNSVGSAIVHDPAFDWQGDDFQRLPSSELVIYELHVGTFNPQGDEQSQGEFSSITTRLEYLQKLGVNAIQVMPVGEFAGERSWGYNPSHIFSVDSDYGGSLALKQFVMRAHRQGIAVILDVVYNHLGPTDLDLWQFDGWSENDRGGIYFYNDNRACTPWGETRPDYGRNEVRQYLLDNVMMWFEEYHLDGLRFDCTQFIRTINGTDAQDDLPEGWSLLQLINSQVVAQFPGRITIAEDLQSNQWLTKDVGAGGAGFGSQWDAKFVHPIRQAVITPLDEQRSLAAIGDAICYRYNDDAFDRVIYSESHDEVANGQARVPQEISPDDPKGWYARKRSTLAAALVFTAPGIPMLFQGQEFLEGGWFRDTVPVDWDQCDEFHGIVRLYRDLIRLRRNLDGGSRGLCGQGARVFHLHEASKIIAFHRWDQGGPGDDVVVVANFSHVPQPGHLIGFPAKGVWKLRFNSDWQGYNDDFGNYPSTDIVAVAGDCDGLSWQAALAIGPYTVLIFSQ